jgi:hypothetical protein
MLTKDKRGIICDWCGLNVIEKFDYFSFDAKEAIVTNNSIVLSKATDPSHSFDICQRCMDEIKDIVIKCYKPSRIIDNKKCPQGITCDLTGIRMNGTFICYYICVSSVSVDINMKPSVNVVDDRYVELWVSKEAFDKLKAKAVEAQNKGSQEWSSQAITTK